MVVIIQLLFKAPPPEEPEPTGHVHQVAALVHAIMSHVLEEFIVFLIDDILSFFLFNIREMPH